MIKLNKKSIIGLLVFFSFTLFVVFYILSLGYVSTDNARVKMGNVQIISEISGYLKDVNIKENQKIAKNDILLEIDNTQYEIDFIRSKHAYNKAKTNFEFTQKEFHRKGKLFEKDFISQSEYNNLKRDFETSKEELDITMQNLKMSEYKLNRTKIIAPNDGIISNFNLKIGDYINIGRPLFYVIDKNDIWVEANFKELDIKNVKIGQKADVKIDAFSGKKWIATVASIMTATGSEFSLLPAQNTSGNWIKVTQRVAIRLKFDENQDIQNLSSGLSAEVKIYTK